MRVRNNNFSGSDNEIGGLILIACEIEFNSTGTYPTKDQIESFITHPNRCISKIEFDFAYENLLRRGDIEEYDENDLQEKMKDAYEKSQRDFYKDYR